MLADRTTLAEGIVWDVTEDLDPREAERARRRDRDLDAEQRALLRPGMGKVFKQIQDAQAKAGREASNRRRRGPRSQGPTGS
jgi:hypothetical protein